MEENEKDDSYRGIKMSGTIRDIEDKNLYCSININSEQEVKICPLHTGDKRKRCSHQIPGSQREIKQTVLV